MVHFLFQIFVFEYMLSGKLPVYQNQKLPQEYGQHFRIFCLAALKLGYHFFKYSFIFQGSACVEYAHIILDATFS